MTAPILIIGNKNYSSWSLRPWLAMKVAGLDFEEKRLPLFEPEFNDTIRQYSPSGKVPALIDGDVTVWESLAICEYLAEKHPDAHLWPSDAGARAHARSVATEMASGFAGLRSQCPMNTRRTVSTIMPTLETAKDVQRIHEIWSDCRERHGADGPFLFGRFSIVDAMYAPVVSRFKSYDLTDDKSALDYMETIIRLPAMQDWYSDAADEPWTIERVEV